MNAAPTIAIEVGPHPRGWTLYQGPTQPEPLFTLKEDAVSYAIHRGTLRKLPVHVLTEDCSIERIIPPNVSNL